MILLRFIYQNIFKLEGMFSLSPNRILLPFALLITISVCLHIKNSSPHLQTTTDQTQQLNYLVNLQNNYASGVRAITQQTKSTRLKIQQTSNIDEKVKLLETAIFRQRQKIGQLNSKLLPDPTQDFSECISLSEEQQLKLSQEINGIQYNIEELESISKSIQPQIKTRQINDEILKMKLKLDGIQKVGEKQCQKNLAKGAAVYQTNLYQNNNWVLGSLNMDQLIDQFYKRSLANNNITNCPLDRPFLKSQGTSFSADQCIKCPTQTPYFDMSTKGCIACPAGKQLNLELRNCAVIKKNSVYNETGRYRIEPLAQTPAPNPQLEYCPINNPYFNGTDCVACPGDSYWQISDLKCYNCPQYSYFDLSTRQCVANPSIYVNGSRDRLLATDKTSIADYDKMLKDSIGKNPNSKPSNCSIPQAYAIVSTCVLCNPDNFQYFNVQTLTCSYCDGVPDPVTNKCKLKVYYFPNFDAANLLYNSSNYTTSKANAEKEVKNKPNTTGYCPLQTPYPKQSRLQCMNCTAENPLYLVQQYQCTKCPDSQAYDPSERKCRTVILLTNYNSNFILTPPETLQDYLNAEAQLNKTNLTKKCPVDKPFTPDGLVCISCSSDTYFTLKSKSCDPCPVYFIYSTSTRKCLQQRNVTNLTAATFIVQDSNNTLSAYSAEIEKIKSQGPYLICPAETPYSQNGICVQCDQPNSYFLLSKRSCGPCSNYQADSQTCPPKPNRYSNLSNYRWITNDGNPDRILTSTINQKNVASAGKCLAFYNEKTKDCVNCQQNYYYNFDTGNCERCSDNTVFDLNTHKCTIAEPAGVYFTNINSAQSSQLIYGGLTFDELNKTQSREMKKNPSSTFCPTDKPFYDNISCIKCPEYKKYFNLRYNLCQVCLANQKLSDHNCLSNNSTIVWQEPVPEHVYPFLFDSL